MAICVALSSSFEGAIFRIPTTGASRVPGASRNASGLC